MVDLVIYHGTCVDGFTAAWACWKNLGSRPTYLAAVHGQDAPEVSGLDVLIVDFSYPRDTLLAMADKAKRLRVWDHHKTAEEDLAGLDFCVFDMERSGAGLAWDLTHDRPRPWIIDYVEDRDLWRWNLPLSKEVNAYLQTLPFDFEEYSIVSDSGVELAETRGQGANAKINQYVREMAKQARTKEFCGHNIPVVNAPYINTSELVGELSHGATFALGWFQRYDGQYQYSLRSRGDFDVSDIAKLYGGGGHKNAAGFVADAPFDQLEQRPVYWSRGLSN